MTDGDAPGTTGRSAADGTAVGRDGQQLVVKLYVALVGVSAVAGFLTGSVVEGLQQPRFLFLIPFPATPAGFAAYGGLTIALVLGIPLGLVVYVSRAIDEE